MSPSPPNLSDDLRAYAERVAASAGMALDEVLDAAPGGGEGPGAFALHAGWDAAAPSGLSGGDR